jgi:hypothetical protein
VERKPLDLDSVFTVGQSVGVWISIQWPCGEF